VVDEWEHGEELHPVLHSDDIDPCLFELCGGPENDAPRVAETGCAAVIRIEESLAQMSRPSERRWFSGSHQVTTLQIRKVEVRPAFLACSQERLNFDISTPPDVVLPLKQGPPGANKTQSLGGARV
jgi:hypothetical protein